ncbi:peptidoglycan-binding protein [Streptomyces sp. NPDC059063]|uniref:peptidoglycan-binding domain-containing protein n=1 Tax=unclassified Streptomyces TaxID=2593676 RepID=UPI00368058D3
MSPGDLGNAAGPGSTEGPGSAAGPEYGAGRACPGCGTARAPDGAPACGCARAAARAALETRSAQAAAAEDFDPLRIRPYVTLPEPEAPLPALVSGASAPLPQEAGPTAPQEASGPADAVYARSARHGRTGLFAGVGVLVASAAVFAGGMFTGGDRGDGEDLALPDTRSGMPDPDPDPEEGDARNSVTKAEPAPSPTTTRPRPTRTPSPSASSSPRAHHAEPPTSPTRTTARATGTVSLPPSHRPAQPERPPAAPALSVGDTGDEVRELQYRLGQLSLYVGPPDGVYSPVVADAVARYQWARGVTDDPRGTYGSATRRALEAETSAP